MADALRELHGVEGAQTHRSWWVARAAVRSVKKSGGRIALTLPNGREALVSRAYARDLRNARWF
jgi:DNA-binding LytR/AlgR family response regulator